MGGQVHVGSISFNLPLTRRITFLYNSRLLLRAGKCTISLDIALSCPRICNAHCVITPTASHTKYPSAWHSQILR